MKFSEAMLKGFERVKGKQHRGDYCPFGTDSENPPAVCVYGAVNLALSGDARNEATTSLVGTVFFREWGFFPEELNDGDEETPPLPWEHIYGMAVAAGL